MSYPHTHARLWVAPDGETQARRVSESQQDIMGFSVVAEDRFIGSGHPGPTQDLPPNLGLIESRDGGRTWDSVSLMGEADFHVLESASERIYGFDGTQGRLMVSTDGGGSWKQRRPPAGVFSLAIDPQDGERILASTELGLFVSADGGESWRAVNQTLAGLLAWPEPGRVFLVEGEGQVQVSANGGKAWEPVGSIGGQPAAFIAHGDDPLRRAGRRNRHALGGRRQGVVGARDPMTPSVRHPRFARVFARAEPSGQAAHRRALRAGRA